MFDFPPVRRIEANEHAEGESLGAGDEGLLDMRVAFRPSGCTSRGGSMRVDPTLVVTHELTIPDLPSFLGTADYS